MWLCERRGDLNWTMNASNWLTKTAFAYSSWSHLFLNSMTGLAAKEASCLLLLSSLNGVHLREWIHLIYFEAFLCTLKVFIHPYQTLNFCRCFIPRPFCKTLVQVGRLLLFIKIKYSNFWSIVYCTLPNIYSNRPSFAKSLRVTVANQMFFEQLTCALWCNGFNVKCNIDPLCLYLQQCSVHCQP